MTTGSRLRHGIGIAAIALLGATAVHGGVAAMQPATPAVPGEIVDPALCPGGDLASPVVVALAAATAVPSGTARESLDEIDLPAGEPIDEQTLAELTKLEQTFTACYNAGDIVGALSVMTDAAVVAMLDDIGDDVDLTTMNPSELNDDELIVLFPLRGARLLPDGRVGAIVEWGRASQPQAVDERNFRIYEQVDGQWRLAAEIPVRN